MDSVSFSRLLRALPLSFVALTFVPLTAPAAPAAADRSQVTLNLKDADITTLIATVSEVTGKNFIIDPRVRGKVTVISSSPMDAAGVYQTFLSVLEVQGFAAVPAGDAIKIIPDSSAKWEGGNVFSSGQGMPGDAMVTHVFALQNSSATQLQGVLRPLIAQTGQIAPYPPSNMLIVSDRAANMQRIAHIIDRIENSGDRDIELVPLVHASATSVVRVLTALQQQDKQSDPTARPQTMIADERSNSVLIGGDKEARTKLLDIIHRLDEPVKGNGGSTQVVFLQYGNAETLAPILQGYAQTTQKAEARNAGAASAQVVAGAGAAPGGSGSEQVTVVADKDTNALVITAPPEIMRMVLGVISQLDIQRSEVLVDAIIAEVGVSKASDLGVDWVIYNPNSVAAAGILNSSTLSAIQTAASSLTSTSTTTSGTTIDSSTLIGAAAGLLGSGAQAVVGKLSGSGTSFGLLLKALASDANTNILSTPSITTMDNQESKITVGQDVPFLSGSFSNTGSASNGAVNPFQTIDRKDVGLTLGVTPTINHGDVIRMKIKLEDSTIASGTAGSSNLITNKRTIDNVVSVHDGQVLVIGGLIDDQVNDSKTKVPVLGDIPFIGALFRSRSVTKTKRNLMVFIHPSIIRTPEDVDFFTRMKYAGERNSEIDTTAGAPIPLVGGKQPVLYDYDDYLQRSNRPPNEGGPVLPSPPAIAPLPDVAPEADTSTPVPSKRKRGGNNGPAPTSAPDLGGSAVPAGAGETVPLGVEPTLPPPATSGQR